MSEEQEVKQPIVTPLPAPDTTYVVQRRDAVDAKWETVDEVVMPSRSHRKNAILRIHAGIVEGGEYRVLDETNARVYTVRKKPTPPEAEWEVVSE